MRNHAREAAFKIVFANLFQQNDDKFSNSVFQHDKLSEEDILFAQELVTVVDEHKEELNGMLAEKTSRYPEYRIYAADRAIMLVALAEIKYFKDIPPVVSVNEATGLARKYSTERSTDFVNGVMGSFINA